MSKIFIIAEAGVNHNGSVELVKQMIEVAAKAGMDAVKFQTSLPKVLVAKMLPTSKSSLTKHR